MLEPQFRITEVQLYERPVPFRLPFRFGAATLTEAPQAFAKVTIAMSDGRESTGASAQMLAPKWFDKNPLLSNDANFDQLRTALSLAATAYLSGGVNTAFGHFAEHYHDGMAEGARHGLDPLVANFGPAVLDQAILDALCKALNLSIYQVIQQNLAGIYPERLLKEFNGFAINRFLATLQPAQAIEARHTIGLTDTLLGTDRPLDDGLPESLQDVVQSFGQRWFKVKISGKVDDDLQRLRHIADVLDQSGTNYRLTLDGNEQFEHIDAVEDLWQRLSAASELRRFLKAIAFIEQPIGRANAWNTKTHALAQKIPLVIDESDATLDSFRHFRDLGYQGVSSKSCKGIYKSIINAARCALWNDSAPAIGAFFMTGEDLTTQPGLAVQQDLALANILGIKHVERNGHFYGSNMTDLPAGERQAFSRAHLDLYHQHSDQGVTLRIENGFVQIGSLDCPGYASAVHPDWTSCALLHVP